MCKAQCTPCICSLFDDFLSCTSLLTGKLSFDAVAACGTLQREPRVALFNGAFTSAFAYKFAQLFVTFCLLLLIFIFCHLRTNCTLLNAFNSFREIKELQLIRCDSREAASGESSSSSPSTTNDRTTTKIRKHMPKTVFCTNRVNISSRNTKFNCFLFPVLFFALTFCHSSRVCVCTRRN